MATLALNTTEVLQAMVLVAGINRTVTNLDADTTQDFRLCIRNGLRAFFHPINPRTGMAHMWRFLERPYVKSAPSDDGYSTGTVTVAAGTVTLAGGTWPTWAADGILEVDGQYLYVTARTSGTVLTVSHDGLAAAAGSTYALYRWRFPLPTDFGEFIGGVTYSLASKRGKQLTPTVDTQIRLQYAANFRTGETKMYAIQAGSATDTSKQYFEFWPTMDAESLIAGTYRATPADQLHASNLSTDGAVEQAGPMHAQALLEAILAEVELYYNDAPGPHAARFETLLAASIAHDLATPGPTFGTVPDGADPRQIALFTHTPDYTAQTS